MIPSMIANILFTQLLSFTPTAVNAIADTPASAIATVGPKFNPCKKMLDAIVTGWVNGIKTLPITGVYVGTIGVAGIVAPTVVTFPASVVATGTFLTTMGWIGTSAVPIANLYTNLLATTTTATAKLITLPIPGAGSGVFTVTPATNVGLASSMGVFNATLTTAFVSQQVFGPTLNPQLYKLISALSIAFATMVASATGISAVAGPVGPSPFTIPFVGTLQ